MRRLDVELEEASIQIIRTQRFQICRQFLFRILIVLGVPADPVRRLQLEQFKQFLFLVRRGTDQIDLADHRRIALVDGEIDGHAITLQRRHRRRHRHRVFAAGQVLPLELLFGALQHAPVKGTRYRKAGFPEPLENLVFVKLLESDKVDLCNCRSFLDGDHDDATVDLDPHVLEKAGGKQRFDRLSRLFVSHRLADLDRQITEHRSRFGALDAFDANILHSEGLESKNA